MRPIACNTELAFVFPEAEERKVNMSIIYKYFAFHFRFKMRAFIQSFEGFPCEKWRMLIWLVI